MVNALTKTKEKLAEWIKENQYDETPVPIVINLVCNKLSESKVLLSKYSEEIKSLKVEDGYVLMLNCLITKNNDEFNEFYDSISSTITQDLIFWRNCKRLINREHLIVNNIEDIKCFLTYFMID